MASIKGWEGKVKYSERKVLEAVGIGDNADVTWDLDYPAVDELGDITDDATKIEVFLDGVLKTPTTDYTLDGDGGTASVGQITFTVAPAQDDVIEASYYAYQTIGYIQSLTFAQNNNVEPVRGLGAQLPIELKTGNIDISLSMSRCFINLNLIAVSVHEISADRGWLVEHLFDIEVYPKGDTGGYPLYIIRGKFNTHGLDLTQDGLAMDNVDMIGKTVTVTVAS